MNHLVAVLFTVPPASVAEHVAHSLGTGRLWVPCSASKTRPKNSSQLKTLKVFPTAAKSNARHQ